MFSVPMAFPYMKLKNYIYIKTQTTYISDLMTIIN